MNDRTPLTGRLLAVCLSASLVLVMPAGAANHVITQSDLAFSPSDIQINVGDSVQWVWTGGLHTVTNGLNLSDPALATLFDAPLDAAHPMFSHTFTSPGTVPYFCRPHRLMGMTGSITVHAVSAVDEVPTRGALALTGAPNPFNPRTVISYALPEAAPVRLSVFDLSGRLVRELLEGVAQDVGPHQTTWDGLGDDGSAAAAGVYVVTVEAAGLRESIKLTLAK